MFDKIDIFSKASRFSMRKHTFTGNIKRHRAFPSRILGNRRDVLVYLPPGYRRFSRKRYPVLYLHDGQNVFDAATSFSGVEWGVDETAERLIRQKRIEPLIIVAIAFLLRQSTFDYLAKVRFGGERDAKQDFQQSLAGIADGKAP